MLLLFKLQWGNVYIMAVAPSYAAAAVLGLAIYVGIGPCTYGVQKAGMVLLAMFFCAANTCPPYGLHVSALPAHPLVVILMCLFQADLARRNEGARRSHFLLRDYESLSLAKCSQDLMTHE